MLHKFSCTDILNIHCSSYMQFQNSTDNDMALIDFYCLYGHFLLVYCSAMDPAIEEAIASIIWAEPRLSADIPELTIVSSICIPYYHRHFV